MEAGESGDGVIARFSDDSTARADVVIGADGIRSTVRSMIDPTAPSPRYTGLLGLGGWTTGGDVDLTNANYHMIFGKEAFFGYEASDDGRMARCLRDLPYEEAFAAYEGHWRGRVTRIIKLAARTNSHKAAGPIARRLRDVIMPLAMKLAKPEKTAWQYNHHIDWEAPVAARQL
jgi:2-polyprenyl-6-methoxyphenol hydroxylase-like FAD-dependent oxidoreductase